MFSDSERTNFGNRQKEDGLYNLRSKRRTYISECVVPRLSGKVRNKTDKGKHKGYQGRVSI